MLLVVDVEDTAAEPAADEWYDHQLVGLTARTPDGRELGRVRSVEHLPAQDLLVIRPVREDEYVNFNTNVYSVADAKLIWASRSETMNPTSVGSLVDEVITANVQEMQKQHVLAK